MLPPSPPGSLFICGHRNVNSLSLSISAVTTVAPTLPHEEVAGLKEQQPQLTSTVTTAWTDAWAAKWVFPLQSLWRVEEMHCCGMCDGCGVSERN